MLAELELEALRFSDRTTLETWQLVSRSARNRVDEHAPSLPLRRLELVDIDECQTMDEWEASIITSMPGTMNWDVTDIPRGDRGFYYDLAIRLRYSYVEKLQLSCVCSEFLQFWHDNFRLTIECRVRTLAISFYSVNYNVCKLGPFETFSKCNSPFFTDVLRISDYYVWCRHLRQFYGIWKNLACSTSRQLYLAYASPPPASLIKLIAKSTTLECCFLAFDHPDTVKWINYYIESFMKSKPVPRKTCVQTVCDDEFEEELVEFPNDWDTALMGRPDSFAFVDSTRTIKLLVSRWTKEYLASYNNVAVYLLEVHEL
ncbi:hypothetical protein AAVH_30858 [Aphelenchoides avenae]|nr:hypothetical protein AAVH_30858 [Aphelenchus avenae]